MGSARLLSREFGVVLAGQAVSALGDAITLTATPLLVLALTGSDGRGALIVLGAVAAAGSLLFAPLRRFRGATYPAAPAGAPT